MRKNKNERFLAENITVSNDTRVTGLNNNDLIIGSSGSGKTGGYVIPNIQNISGSLVVTDTKCRLSKMFGDTLKRKGYKVYTLDFVNPMNSCGYNPLMAIRRKTDGRYREQDILSAAAAIMPQLDKDEPFWEKAAAGYIAFLISFCLETCEEQDRNLKTVCELHHIFIGRNGQLSFLNWAKDHPDTFAAKKFKEISSAANAEKMWSSIIEFANRALEPFEFDEADSIFANPLSVDIGRMGIEKTVLFLNISDTDRTYDQLINLFYTQALQTLCAKADENPDGRLEVPVRIIMDDFAAGTRIPNFDKIISVIRSREISVSLILQSMTQLESMYREAEASTIINNCDHILYLGTQDIKTAEFVSYRAFKTPESVLCMPLNQAILITKGEKAAFVNKIMPYSTMNSSISLVVSEEKTKKQKEAV